MENLLSLAFDNLSSFDGPKVRKGLRQVEGLLAQICLSGSDDEQSSGMASEAYRTDSHGIHIDEEDSDAVGLPPKKDLAHLSRDPAFREFFKLQEGFEWNVATRLVSTLDRLLAQGGDGSNDLLILSALDLMQGLMLLHPPSKAVFSREQNMNVSHAVFSCSPSPQPGGTSLLTCSCDASSSSSTSWNPSTARPSSPPPS